ncbi:MAG: response regulator transcription factor [Ignavibacteriae bacterium]|jgi:DNA-binding NarL/FixJ family response regulator|nr:DNA-binding response regulator [Ignavibacteriota bacterium]NOG99036.1 response regulator transcription factor [Ignavibacteriota bacterium]
MNDKINILIADDHAILRDGLKSALSIDESLNIIGEAENGVEVIELCKKLNPDIILMDINMPEMDGIRASKHIKKECHHIKIIILTMFDNRQYISDALSAGIDGFVFKMAHIEELLKAIKTVYDGDEYFDPEVLKIMKQNYLRSDSAKNFDLTPREYEIITYIAKGLTVSEIADTLSISYSTVKNHRHNILSKLNLKNSAELVRYAITEGLIK